MPIPLLLPRLCSKRGVKLSSIEDETKSSRDGSSGLSGATECQAVDNGMNAFLARQRITLVKPVVEPKSLGPLAKD